MPTESPANESRLQTFRELEFGDGTYRFKLNMAQLLAIEEKCGRTGAVYARLLCGRYEVNGSPVGFAAEAAFGIQEVLEICRQALIGGGQGFVDGREIKVGDHLATHLVRTYLAPESGNPITKPWDLAYIVMHAAMEGYERPAGEVSRDADPAPAGAAVEEAGS